MLNNDSRAPRPREGISRFPERLLMTKSHFPDWQSLPVKTAFQSRSSKDSLRLMIALSISSCFIFGAHRIILPASLRSEEKEYRKERNLIFQVLKRNHGGKTAEQRSFSIYTFSMCTTIVPLSPFSLPFLAGRRFRGFFSSTKRLFRPGF